MNYKELLKTRNLLCDEIVMYINNDKISKTKLAQQASISRATIHNMLRGVFLPNLSTLNKIKEIMNDRNL